LNVTWFDPFTELSGAQLSTVYLVDALHAARVKMAQLRADTETGRDNAALTLALHRVGQLALTLGMGQIALDALTEALALTPLPDIRRSLGWAQRLCGQYNLAHATFTQAQTEAVREAALAQIGLAQCALDTDQWAAALTIVEAATPQLNQANVAHYVLIAQFIKAELYIRLGQDADAYGALDQLDVHLTTAKLQWFRPEWWALKARLALAKGDSRAAEKAARLGLGAVDDRGDGQMLPTLYRTLAATLERDRTGSNIDDARDARHRSLVAAQNRGPQIEIARSLFEVGLHYKLYASLPTRRARGSGYLYEADKLYQAMGVTMPPSNGASVALL
jgi:tetratricopeptide (TPR) repeat protein